jgi:hypothetical protein
MESMIDQMAKAAWEDQRARFNPTVTEGPEYELKPWEEEPEALREDWRRFMRIGMEVAAKAGLKFNGGSPTCSF